MPREFKQMALCCPNFPGRFWLLLQFQSSFSLPVATASLASTAEFRIEFLVIKVSKLSIIHLGLFSFCKECMVNMDVGWYIEEKRKKVWDVQVCCSIVNIGAFLNFSSSNNFKVHLFWEGHKIWKNLPLCFDLT